MYIRKILPFHIFVEHSLIYVIFFAAWSSVLVCLHTYFNWELLAIPFLPVSLVGTAVAFYLGFKNNSSYDRLWEARKIWGGIINESRAFAIMLNTYLPAPGANREADRARLDLIRRHIAWLYAHKFLLRNKRLAWEHQADHNNRYRKMFQEHFQISTDLQSDLSRFIEHQEIQSVMKASNPAIQLLNNQATHLAALRAKGFIEDFRLFELQNQINKLVDCQGRNERIKNFPFPRQYALICNLFIWIFIFLLPLGLISEMTKLNENLAWLTVPFTTLISWVFFEMNVIGEYSENPFEGLINDIPITSMTRNLEIDLLQLIGEKECPPPIESKDGVLM